MYFQVYSSIKPYLPLCVILADSQVIERFGIDRNIWRFAGEVPHGPTSKDWWNAGFLGLIGAPCSSPRFPLKGSFKGDVGPYKGYIRTDFGTILGFGLGLR